MTGDRFFSEAVFSRVLCAGLHRARRVIAVTDLRRQDGIYWYRMPGTWERWNLFACAVREVKRSKV